MKTHAIEHHHVDTDQPATDAADNREQTLQALRWIVCHLAESRTPTAAWNRLHALAWHLRLMPPNVRSQRQLATRLGITEGTLSKSIAELRDKLGI